MTARLLVAALLALQFTSVDQLVAPIALYPDQLLAQMLMSASDPAEGHRARQWLKANPKLKGTPLQDAAVKAGFEPSFVALGAVPSSRGEDGGPDRLDDAARAGVRGRSNAVFASIQKLRHQAQNVGTLKSTPQQEVETKTTSTGQEVIVIEPTNPQIVYVPQYNTAGRLYTTPATRRPWSSRKTTPTRPSRPV